MEYDLRIKMFEAVERALERNSCLLSMEIVDELVGGVLGRHRAGKNILTSENGESTSAKLAAGKSLARTWKVLREKEEKEMHKTLPLGSPPRWIPKPLIRGTCVGFSKASLKNPTQV